MAFFLQKAHSPKYLLPALFLAQLLFAPNLVAQGHRDPRFETLDFGSGRGHSFVTSILQDQSGFLWCGTTTGLVRYDGEEYRVFLHKPEEPNSLVSNTVWSIAEDSRQRIWVATNNGVSCFDPKSETFTNFRQEGSAPGGIVGQNFLSVCEASDGRIWIGSEKAGVNIFDPATEKFDRIFHDRANPNGLLPGRVHVIRHGPEGEIWLGHYGGLSCYQPDTKEFVHYLTNGPTRSGFRDRQVRELFFDSEQQLWIGTHAGLARFNPKEGQVEWVQWPDDGQDFWSSPIYGINEDKLGRLWVASYSKGIRVVEKDGRIVQSAFFDPENDGSVSSRNLDTVYCDRSGNIWIGTFGGGVCRYQPRRDLLQRLAYSPKKEGSIIDGVAQALLVNAEQELLLGTTKGLARKLPGEIKFERIHVGNNNNAIPNVRSICTDGKDGYWMVASGSRVLHLNADFEVDKQLLTENVGGSSFGAGTVQSVYLDFQNRLWISTTSGLYLKSSLDAELHHFHHEPSNPVGLASDNVGLVICDGNSQVWVAAGGQMHLFDAELNGFQRLEVVPLGEGEKEVWINSAVFDSNGQLWLAGTFGLARFDVLEHQFQIIPTPSEFRGAGLKSLALSADGILWVGTWRGLYCYDPQTDELSPMAQRIGFPANSYLNNIALSTADGTLWFAGHQGVDVIRPQEVPPPLEAPRTVITKVQFVDLALDSPGAVYENKLTHKQDAVSFNFAALEYSNAVKNQYQCRLIGYESDWRELGTKNTFTYTNLSPAHYLFQVRGRNSDGIWSAEPAKFAFSISPPFWATWWFRMLGSLVVVAAIWSWHWLRLRRVRIKNEELKVLNDQLEEENHLRLQAQEDLAITLHSIGDGVISTDAENGITAMNSVAEKLTGWTAAEASGRQIEEVLRLVHSATGEAVPLALSDSNMSPQLSRQSLLKNRNDDEFMVAKTLAPIRRPDGEVTGMVVVFRDVTHEIELEAQVQQTQRMESLGLLAGGIAHDFNNIIGGILAYAELLSHAMADGDSLGEAEKKYPQKIMESSRRAAALTRQLLTFAKKRDPEIRNVDVHRLIENCIGFLRKTIRPDIVVSAEMNAVAPVVKADLSLLESALINLGVNAADAMESGGSLTFATRPITLHASMLRENEELVAGECLEIAVVDTGCGMAGDVQGRIFEPFYTTKGPGKGTGLGLSTVFGNVQSLGGTIRVESEVGRGSTFRMLLPLEDSSVRVPFTVTKGFGLKGNGTVLIIDDEKAICDVYKRYLETLGYQVFVATEREAGIELFKQHAADIDVVLMDFVMPGMSGQDALKELKTFDPAAKVIVISGFSLGVGADDVLALGASAFLEKPFRNVELSKKLSEIRCA